MRTRILISISTIGSLLKSSRNKLVITVAMAAATSFGTGLSAQEISSPKAKHKTYRVVVLPPDGGADSFLAGYLEPFCAIN
jgi:hypothetical protein